MCVWITTWVKSKDLTWLRWVGAQSIYVDTCNLSSWLLEFSWCMPYKLLNMSLHSKLAFRKNLPISCIVVSWTKTWIACEYIQSTHWLATGYLIDQAWKNRSSKKSSLETNMRTRTCVMILKKDGGNTSSKLTRHCTTSLLSLGMISRTITFWEIALRNAHSFTMAGNRSWATSTCLQTSVCVWITTCVKSKDLTWLSWVDAHSIYVDICDLSS